MPAFDPDTAFTYKWVPVAGAAGGVVSELVKIAMYASQKDMQYVDQVGHLLQMRALFILICGICAGCTALMVAILADLNRERHHRICASGFAIGVVWQGAWGQIGEVGKALVDALQTHTAP
jgi:ApbE superfamily uncharacterized protein (UPF0280 family)